MGYFYACFGKENTAWPFFRSKKTSQPSLRLLPKKASFGPYKYSVPSQRLPPKKSRQTNQANTLPETKVAPENRPSQKKTSIPTIHF